MAILEALRFQLYERRLENCLVARDRCAEGTWGWTFWQTTFITLLRQMNREMNYETRH